MNLMEKIKLCFTGFFEDESPQSAAAISFYAVTSLPPLVVLLVSCAGLLISDQAFQAYLIAQVGQLFGPSGAEVISMIIVQSADGRHGTAALLGFLLLMLTAGGLHAQLQAALNKVWNINRHPQPFFQRFLGDRLLATLTIAATGMLLIVSLFVTTFIQATSKWLDGKIEMEFISAQRTQNLTTFILLTVMVALLYKLLPDARVAWRDVWKGAFLTSVLFAGTRWVLALYLSRGSLTVSYGQAGTLVVLLVWIYFSSLIFLFGAEWTSIEAKIKGREIVAKQVPDSHLVLSKIPAFPAQFHECPPLVESQASASTPQGSLREDIAEGDSIGENESSRIQ